MDLFEQETHPALKGALVACLQGKWSDHSLKVQALLSDGSSLALELQLTRADYENEPATRISIPARHKKDLDLEVRLAEAVKNDASTRFLQQRYLVAALRERCAATMKGGVRQFAHIKPDRFIDIQLSIGVLASEDFMAQLADLLRVQLTPTDICGRFGGNGFLIMLERGTARDWSNAKEPCETARKGRLRELHLSECCRSCLLPCLCPKCLKNQGPKESDRSGSLSTSPPKREKELTEYVVSQDAHYLAICSTLL